MHLQTLTLEQFRNYSHLEFQFLREKPLTLIIGQNAQGKTNILEAIYLLALTKSFRTGVQEDLIGWNKEFARIQGTFEAESQKVELECFLGCPPNPHRALKKNGVKISAADFIGNCRIVFFHPEDLNMLYLGPDLRRRFLDIMNIQVSKNYFQTLRAYRRVLQQRNALLAMIKNGNAAAQELAIWDDQLSQHGSFLMSERAKTVHFLQKYLQEYYRKISNGSEKGKVNYRHTLGFEADDLLKETADQEQLRNFYKKTLKNAQQKDLKAQMTTIGPHRDELEFYLNDLKLVSHASRGEYRSLLLALKLLELKFLEQQTQTKPLLLLDDVFSELDANRQQMLLRATQGHQTIITTTDPDILKDNLEINDTVDVLKIEKSLSSCTVIS
jgi:DNA replication and repair protein RecF